MSSRIKVLRARAQRESMASLWWRY